MPKIVRMWLSLIRLRRQHKRLLKKFDALERWAVREVLDSKRELKTFSGFVERLVIYLDKPSSASGEKIRKGIRKVIALNFPNYAGKGRP